MTGSEATQPQCRNGHPWEVGQTTCPQCGAVPRTQWGPVGAIRPPGYPHSVGEWVVTGTWIVLLALVFYGVSESVDSEGQFVTLRIIGLVLGLTGWFFLTVGAVIKGASIALADRDRDRR